MNDVIVTTVECRLQLPLEPETNCHPCLGAVEIDRLASSNPDHIGRGACTFDVGSDDVDVMTETPCLTREKVNMLADPAEVGIVILGDERDSEWPGRSADYWRNLSSHCVV